MIHFWSEYTNIMYIKSYWDIIVQTYELLDNLIHMKYEPPIWKKKTIKAKKMWIKRIIKTTTEQEQISTLPGQSSLLSCTHLEIKIMIYLQVFVNIYVCS